jgi:hypothetical protein
MTKNEEQRIFNEAVNGYGFTEVSQTPDGVYCTGCCYVHKRPTKMYKGGMGDKDVMCKYAIVKFYNPEINQ